MPELLSDTGVRPLILELLARRNWFDPQRLEEIEETLQKAKAGTLSEVTLIGRGSSPSRRSPAFTPRTCSCR